MTSSPTRAARHARRYGCRAGASQLGDVRFETDDPAAADWMDAFVRPWFEPAADGDARDVVRLVHDDGLAAACVAAVGPDAPRAPCFALDTRRIAYPARDVDGVMVVRDLDRGCSYRLERGHVAVVARRGDRRPRLAALRVMRELLLAGAGRPSLHAAAVEVGASGEGRAVAIAGPKRAGKTTLLCYLLSSGAARFIANDRLLVDVSGARARADGVPTVVSVRAGTLREFPEVGSDLPGTASVSHLLESELATGTRGEGETRPPGGGRIRMTPAHFSTRIGVARARGAPLAAILLPEITSSVDGWEVERLPTGDAAALLQGARYGRGRDGWRTLFSARAGADDAPAGIDGLERVPVFRCRLGPAAYASRAAAQDLLGEVL